MPPTRGNVVAILTNSGKANPRAFAEERLGVLASNHKSAGNDAAALRLPDPLINGGFGPPDMSTASEDLVDESDEEEQYTEVDEESI